MSENTYIGLTIGPIVKTLSNARQSRELWGASYMFSYIMKKIIDKWRKKREFIIPFTDNDDKEGLFDDSNHFKGAGLFADKLIFVRKDDDDLKKLRGSVEIVINKFAEKMATSLDKDSELVAVKAFLNKYLQIYCVEKTIKNDENPIFIINSLLDGLELQTKYLDIDVKYLVDPVGKKSKEQFNYLEHFLDYTNMAFLKKEVFANKENLGAYKGISDGFPSISNIAAIEIIRKYKSDLGDNNFEIAELKEKLVDLKKVQEFKFRHKYICIVYADGDNISKTIEKLGKLKKGFEEFSKSLFDFAKKSANLISDFGGKPVFIGGDDLLFFAPVVHVEGKESIFHLLDKLNKIFEEEVKPVAENVGVIELPSLSFGLSISYYKFPMNEALEISRDLLFEQAKEKKEKKEKKKNNIAFKISKHSGQQFNGFIHKSNTGIYHKFLFLIDKYLNSDKRLFNSLTYRLQEAKTILENIATDKERIKNYFENSFNEPIHKTKDGKEFIEDLADLLYLIFDESEKSRPFKINQFYSYIRTIHFLQQED